jgi:YfiR/HmsC-like
MSSSGHAGSAVVAPPAGPLSNWRSIRCVAILAIFSLVLADGTERTKAQTTAEEYRVKAAFIFHFAQLVDWPPETLTSTDNSLVLCTLGEDPFQGTLEGTVAGKTIGNRVIRIRHLGEPKDMQACQILFLGKVQSKRMPMLVTTLHNAPVLIVGETAGFLEEGGMIRFLLEEDKVRFDINLNAAESARLKIGSRLLILAEHVVGEGHGK